MTEKPVDQLTTDRLIRCFHVLYNQYPNLSLNTVQTSVILTLQYLVGRIYLVSPKLRIIIIQQHGC